MSERDFESQLQALLAQPAVFPDAEDFVLHTRQRLRQRRILRGLVLGTSGVLAGIASVCALLASDLPGQLQLAAVLLLKLAGGFGIYWTVIGVLLLLALALATNLDDDCVFWDGTR